jgi:hypothetical protein
MKQSSPRSDPRRTTALLGVLVVAAAGACLLGGLWLSGKRSAAQIAADNLAAAQSDLEAIRRMRMAPGQSVATALDAPEVSKRIRQAATAAGLDEPSSIEASPPARLGTTDYTETPVYLGLEPLTLKQLVTFLHHLCQLDPAARVRQIELSTPEPGTGAAAPATNQEEDVWTAGVAVGYLTYSPRK